MILYFFLFILTSLASFTLPGIFLLQKVKVNFSLFEKIVLGSIIGFVFFTLISYFLIILKIPFLIFLIIGLIDIFFLKGISLSGMDFTLPPKKHLIILTVVFCLGILGQLAIIAPSGLIKDKDLVFYSSNGHDGPWHIALMEEIKKGYPLQNPVFAGEKLVNYHFFSDLAPAQFSKYFRFSNLDLYFRFFPFLYSLLLGAVAYFVGKKVGGSFTAGIWSTFFVYFAGSFGFFVTWVQNRTIGGESIFWATQIQSSIGNPPQIISNILVLTFIYLFIIYLNKKDFYVFIFCVAILGSLTEFKIYAAVVLLISLGFVGLIQAVKERRFSLLSMFLFSAVFSAILYLPNSSNSTAFLIWEPWWFIRTMIVANSRLDWIDLELRRQTYIAENNLKRVIQIELTGFLIFFFGNLGTRFLGLIYIIKSLKTFFADYIFQILISISIVSLILPLLFLQKGVASNTIQFIQYFLLIFGLFAAFSITNIQNKIKNNFKKIIFVFIIIVFSVPTQIGLIYGFYQRPPLAKITNEEIQALNFLNNNSSKDSIIMTPPYNKYLDLKMSTPFIWGWFDTSYVSAFSSRRVYLADLEQVDIMGYQYKQRLEIQKFIFESNKLNEIINKLKIDKIDYLYFPKKMKPNADLSTKTTKIFDNGLIEILKVN